MVFTLRALNGPLKGKSMQVDKTPYRIGKAPSNDLLLEHNTVSRLHCQLEIHDHVVRIRDLGSTNGTVVDGAPVQLRELGTAGVLSIGALDFRFEVSGRSPQDPQNRPESFGAMVGRCPAMQQLFEAARRLCGNNVPIAISGPEGSGRRALARTLLTLSEESSRQLRVVNGGDAEEIHAYATGQLDASGVGLLFVDVHRTPAALRPTLLEALRMHSTGMAFRRLPVRLFLTYTERAPASAQYFCSRCIDQLQAAHLALPALAKRRSDIPLLAEALLARYCAAQQLSPRLVLSEEAQGWLADQHFPLQVRGLEQCIVHGAVSALEAERSQIELSDLNPAAALGVAEFDPELSYREQKALVEGRFEREYLAWLLRRHQGNASAASRAAAMDRKYLYKLAKKHGLK